MPETASLYETDFYEWSNVQADHIKNKRFSEIDIENIAEEIESLGRSDKKSIRSHIINLFMHLLKCDYQPERKTKSWSDSICEAQYQINDILNDSPSLRRLIPELAKQAYPRARERAILETNLHEDTFPKECPNAYMEYLKD